MKRSGLLALSMVSLVALVGCGNNGGGKPAKYATEKKIASETVVAFFGQSALGYLDVGDEVVYEGKDSTTGEAIYGPGASFGVVLWDSEDDEGNVSTCTAADFLYTIGYEEDESGAKSAPAIAKVIEDNDMYNVTKQMYSTAPASYFKKEGGQDYLYCNLAEGFEGKQLGGVYCTVDEDLYFQYVLSVELICLRSAKADLADIFGEAAAASIQESGYFDAEDKINVCMADITCQNWGD